MQRLVDFKGRGDLASKGGDVVCFKGTRVVGFKSGGKVEFMGFSDMTGWHRSCHVSDAFPRWQQNSDRSDT
jgi:hypothetical protein